MLLLGKVANLAAPSFRSRARSSAVVGAALTLLLLLCVTPTASCMNSHRALQGRPLRTDYKEEDYVKYFPGNASIIITAPHGGYLEPDSIPDRIAGCPVSRKGRAGASDDCEFTGDSECADEAQCGITTVTDSYTIDVATMITDEIEILLGEKPHLVYMNLRRTKVDANREIHEAAQGNPEAEAAYLAFHDYIEQASTAVGRGILFDIHGQSHDQNSTECGYLISTSDLNSGNYVADDLSIRTLAQETGRNASDLLTGPDSFGAKLEEQGFNAVPSPRQPSPGEDKYFSGGYITETHGSVAGGSVDAIQLETPGEVRISGGEEMRVTFSKAVARAIVNYYRTFYDSSQQAGQ